MPKRRYYLHSGGRDFSTYSGRTFSTEVDVIPPFRVLFQ